MYGKAEVSYRMQRGTAIQVQLYGQMDEHTIFCMLYNSVTQLAILFYLFILGKQLGWNVLV